MIQACIHCHKLIEDGDVVAFKGRGIYHTIPSTSSFALEKNTLEIDPGTLLHEECSDAQA